MPLSFLWAFPLPLVVFWLIISQQGHRILIANTISKKKPAKKLRAKKKGFESDSEPDLSDSEVSSDDIDTNESEDDDEEEEEEEGEDTTKVSHSLSHSPRHLRQYWPASL